MISSLPDKHQLMKSKTVEGTRKKTACTCPNEKGRHMSTRLCGVLWHYNSNLSSAGQSSDASNRHLVSIRTFCEICIDLESCLEFHTSCTRFFVGQCIRSQIIATSKECDDRIDDIQEIIRTVSHNRSCSAEKDEVTSDELRRT